MCEMWDIGAMLLVYWQEAVFEFFLKFRRHDADRYTKEAKVSGSEVEH